ncbi:MAG: trp operon repressor [Spirochaetaceae bacterium]|jgi:TrpR family trp operon transcriptional repressor|nr:trp operon repressor [Spirochaetaceae bacterium]
MSDSDVHWEEPHGAADEQRAADELRTEAGLKDLCAVLKAAGGQRAADDADLLEDFFRCLFTPAELRDIVNRWLLVEEIDRGTPQREIARMFSMSLCKITRGSRELKKSGSGFRRMLELREKLKGKTGGS